MTSDEIGIVIIGRNEGERLIECLASIKSGDKAIVYVDSGSNDGSVAAAEAIGVFVVNLDLGRPFTAARARNEGCAALRVMRPHIRYVQFVDGDCVVLKDWFVKARNFLETRADVAIVCGRRRERYPAASIYNRLCDIEWDTPVGEAMSCGGDALVRVEAFEAVGGYRAHLIAGEEPEFCLRLRGAGWKIWRLDEEMTKHDAAMHRFGQWWIRSVRSGHAYAEVVRLHWTAPLGIWRRETASVIIWGGILPLVVCLGSLIHPIALLGVLAYVLQICRIALFRRPTSSHKWLYAVFVMIAKFAQFQGIAQFHLRQWRHKSSALIEYK
jgi:GT2 family glycosyltransferase